MLNLLESRTSCHMDSFLLPKWMGSSLPSLLLLPGMTQVTNMVCVESRDLRLENLEPNVITMIICIVIIKP